MGEGDVRWRREVVVERVLLVNKTGRRKEGGREVWRRQIERLVDAIAL